MLTDESKFKDALVEAYATPALDDTSAERITRRAQAPKRSRPIKLWGGILAAGALCAASALAYPIVDANLFCLSLASKLSPDMTCIVTLYVNGDRKKPKTLAIYRGEIASDELAGTTFSLDRNRVIRTIDTAQHVAVNAGANANNLFFEPVTLVGALSKLDANRRLTRLPGGDVDGRTVNRFQLESDQKNMLIQIALFADTGQVAEFRTRPEPAGGFPDLDMFYDYDEKLAKREFDAVPKSYDHELYLNKRNALMADYGRRSLLTFRFKRDVLTVHSLEKIPGGAVFLLYTMKGYHHDQEQPFIGLRDAAGTKWLPDCVQLSAEPGGRQFVGEILYPPLGARTVPTELYVIRQDWEFLPLSLMQPLSDKGYSLEGIGQLRPVEVSRAPDWFFLHVAPNGWEGFEQYGELMQIHRAVETRDFTAAADLGDQLVLHMPAQDLIHLASRNWLLLDMYYANKGMGRPDAARQYLKESLDISTPYLGSEFTTKLKSACKRERLSTAKLNP